MTCPSCGRYIQDQNPKKISAVRCSCGYTLTTGTSTFDKNQMYDRERDKERAIREHKYSRKFSALLIGCGASILLRSVYIVILRLYISSVFVSLLHGIGSLLLLLVPYAVGFNLATEAASEESMANYRRYNPEHDAAIGKRAIGYVILFGILIFCLVRIYPWVEPLLLKLLGAK